MDKVTPDALMTFLWVAAAVIAFALAAWALIDRIHKTVDARREINAKLDRDKKRIDSLEEGNKAICRGVLALLSHSINGNSIEKLTAARDGLTNYLIDK